MGSGCSCATPRNQARIRTNSMLLRLVCAGIACAALVPAQETTRRATVVKATKPTAASKKWVMPRMPDGHPDLQGVWTNSTLTPLERPADLANKDHFASQQEAD